jgi:hypothetical protein
MRRGLARLSTTPAIALSVKDYAQVVLGFSL